MPIRPADLVTNLLRATASTLAWDAWCSLAAQGTARRWLALVVFENGRYGVIAADQLKAASVSSSDTRTLADLAVPGPTLYDDEIDDLKTAPRSPTGYYVVLRDGEPLGVLQQRRGGAVLDVESQPAPSSFARLEPVVPYENRYVNTDFASDDSPATRLARTAALAPGAWYVFRVGIGELERDSLEQQPTPLPLEQVGQDVDLDVVVWSEDFALEEGRRSGTVTVPVRGPVVVRTPVASSVERSEAALAPRLMFRVQAPQEPGVAALRCNIYCRGFLLQSRLIRAVVGSDVTLDATGARQAALLDFNLSSSLAAQRLNALEPQRLSIMLNSTGVDEQATHTFRLAGTENDELFTGSVVVGPGEVGDMIESARSRLREVAWGAAGEWNGEAYRYTPGADAVERARQFRADLIALARRGANLYSVLATQLAGTRAGERQLHELLRTPGQIQMAHRVSANDVIPLAMFYDYRLDDQADLTLCSAFEASLARNQPLIDEPCFRGDCPNRDDRTVVCPGGFWGFRHDIGMPFPVRPRGPDMATEIAHHGAIQLDIAFFQSFPQGAGHIERLKHLPVQASSASERDVVLRQFTEVDPHLVYFYCHGIDQGAIPFLRVGSEQDEAYISTSNLLNYDVDWSNTRPLVLINGCHTTALRPDRILSFVRAFVEDALAAGVIGTEITVFEPLAQRFAETFLQQFIAGVPLGRAIRQARLTLLADQNPLGLVYIPHAYGGLRLTAL